MGKCPTMCKNKLSHSVIKFIKRKMRLLLMLRRIKILRKTTIPKLLLMKIRKMKIKLKKTESAKKNEDKNSIESLKDIASKITAVEVLQEAIVEGITEYAIKTDIENAMIVTIAKVGGIIEEMWKRANWIGKYKQE